MLPSELFADQRKRCRGEIAKDASGDREHPLSPRAVSWCIRGGFMKCRVSMFDNRVVAMGEEIAHDFDYFNEKADHAQVVALLTKHQL